MKKYQTVYTFVAVLVLAMPFIVSGNWPVYFFKPMIGLILLASVFRLCPAGNIKYLLLIAVGFSWFGDLFLMFPIEEMFLLGLGSFLVCQVFYAIVFFKIGSQPLVGPFSRIGSLLVFIYWLLLIFFLFPFLGELFIPVLIYSLAISSMLALAIGLEGKIDRRIAVLIIGGAAFFVMSDSLLASDKFVEPLPFSRLLVMSTYLLAQYGIVFGVLAKQREKESG